MTASFPLYTTITQSNDEASVIKIVESLRKSVNVLNWCFSEDIFQLPSAVTPAEINQWHFLHLMTEKKHYTAWRLSPVAQRHVLF